jgi:hypothetical protein
MSVTLLDVLGAAQARRLSLVGETIGYLVLALADQVVDAPRRVIPDAVLVGQDGAVSILSSTACSSAEAETDLRSLLRQILSLARVESGALARMATREHPGATRGLVGAIEAALVPINRAAGRRALGRLYRETRRAIEEGIVRPADARASVDNPGPARAHPEPACFLEGSSETDDARANAHSQIDPDPVLEVHDIEEVDDEWEEVLSFEPPTARLTQCTAPLPPVSAPGQSSGYLACGCTEPLSFVGPRASAVIRSDDPCTAPLPSVAPSSDCAAPGEANHAGDETGRLDRPDEPLVPDTVGADFPESVEVCAEAERSMDLGDFIAAAAGPSDPRPAFQLVPAPRRILPGSSICATDAGLGLAPWDQVPCLPLADERSGGPLPSFGEDPLTEWLGAEDETERSFPPPLVWLESHQGDSTPGPTWLAETVLAEFDGNSERLRIALSLLGDSEARATNAQADSPDWRMDLEPVPDHARPGPVARLLTPPPDPAALWRAPRVFEPAASDVDELVGRFSVSAGRTQADLCRYLTEVAGLDRTPPPPPLTGRPIIPVGALPRMGADPSERRMRAVKAVWASLQTGSGAEHPADPSGEAEARPHADAM